MACSWCKSDPTLGIPTSYKFLGILLELEYWKFLKAQFALTLILPCRYSTVIMISMDIVNSQISLEMDIISLFCVAPIFIWYKMALILLTWNRLIWDWTLSKTLKGLLWWLIIPEHWCRGLTPGESTIPLLTVSDNMPLNPFWRNLYYCFEGWRHN